MKLADIIEALIATGGTPDQILAVVRAAEAEQDAAEARAAAEKQAKDDRRRAVDAERQRRHRLSRAVTDGHDVSRVTDRNERDTPLPSPLPSSSPPNPPSNYPSPQPTPLVEARARVSTVIPAISTIEAEFDEFWRVYPHKVGKPEAFKAFTAARVGAKVRGKPTRQAVPLADLLTGVANYTRDKPPDHNWLNPSTFLNQERYFDEPAAVTGKRRMTTTDDLADMLAQARLDIEAEERAERDPRREIAYVHR